MAALLYSNGAAEEKMRTVRNSGIIGISLRWKNPSNLALSGISFLDVPGTTPGSQLAAHKSYLVKLVRRSISPMLANAPSRSELGSVRQYWVSFIRPFLKRTRPMKTTITATAFVL